MALNDYTCSALTGGGTGALDKISSSDGLQDNDRAKVLTSDGVYWYLYDSSGADTEDGYLYIEPDSESGCWYLVGTTPNADDNFHYLDAITAISGADELLIYDSSIATYKKITRANFLSGVATAEQPYDIGGTFNGSPTDSLIILRYPMPRSVIFPSSLTSSLMIADTAATAETVFSLQKNDVEFGTATFAASGTSATFAATSETVFLAGDILTIVAPASADATLADLGWAIVGTR